MLAFPLSTSGLFFVAVRFLVAFSPFFQLVERFSLFSLWLARPRKILSGQSDLP